jgi:TP901 family phage tail tape measure protein
MAEEIRIPVSADTSRMEADISNAARRAQVTVAPTINARGLEAISRPLGKITGQADEFTKSMEAANARVLAFGASVGVLNAVAKAFGTIVSSSIEVEKTLTEIAVVSGETTKNIESLGRGIFNVAKLTGTSFKDAANAALEFSRQGAGMEESLRRAQAALVLTRTTGLDATESVRGLTAAVSSFNDVGLDYEKVVNKLAAVDTKFAVSSRDLIEGITRSASVAQEAGVSFDELTALITTLQEKTARGGAVIGNALKTIFTRVQGTENLDLLRSLGIAVNDVEGNILPATTIIKKLAAEIQNLDDATRKSVLIKIGGGFQIDKLSAVLKDVADANGVFARSLSESQTAANQAFTKVEQLGKTTGAAFDKLVLSSNELASNIGKIGISGNLKNIIEGLDSVVGSVNKAITGGDEGETIGNKLAQGIIAGIGSVLSGPGLLLAVGVGLKLLTNFGKFLAESVQTQLGVNTAKKEQASLEKDIFSALTKNQDVQTAILSLEGNKAKQAEYILGIYKQQAAFLEKMSSISKTIAPVLYEGGIRSSTEGVKDVKKAAGGFVPIGSAIAEERKNSPAGSRIIVDNNFPMGGGKTGTMVYNSNERRVRNFAGTGGDAIIPNYRPKSAAKGYIPNFASGSNNPAVNTTGLPDLVLDASRYGIAGLTIGGDEDVIRARFKRENLIDAVKKDPLLSKVFQKYGAFGVSNVPVGNVYRRENKNLDAIKAKEEDIKNLFKSRANATLSPQIGDFIKQELSYLQIKPTEAMDYALKEGQKFDFINDQTAGNFFEIMLKAANMDFLDDNWGQFTAASGSDERSSFDIYNLKSGIAKEYGLPEKNYDFVEVKARKADLVKDLTRKTINELLKGGSLRDRFLTDYGKGVSAAGGYIPNFAITGLSSQPVVLAGRVFEALLRGDEYLDITENEIAPDIDKGYYKIAEAKMSVDAALKDSNFGKGKPKGNTVIVPKDSSTEKDEILKNKKGSEIRRPQSDKFLRGNIIGIARKILERESKSKNTNPKRIALAHSGYIPNFAKTQNISGSAARFGSNIGGALESGLPLESIFDNWKGTRLLGTNVGSEKQGERWLDSTIVDLYEDSIVASILGNNTFFTPSDDQTVLKQLETFVLKQSAQGAIINTGRSGFAGLGSQVYDVKPENILQAKVSGKFKKIDYTKLAKVFPRLWRAKGLGDVWERVKLGAKYVAATNKSFYGYKNPESYKASQELRENTAKLRNAAIDAVRKYDTSILGFNVGIENTDDAGYIAKETLGTVSDKNLSYLMPFSSAPFSNIESLKVKKDREHAKIKQDRQEREARKVALKTFIQQVTGGNYKAYSTWKEWQYGRSPELKKLLDEFESIPGNPSTGVKEWISSIKYDTASKRLKAQSGLRIPNFANGIPNFSEGPLMDAIQREKLESGLPISAISVVKDNKLKNPQNPSGLAVINKRDEPNGKIPNFAEDRVTEIIFNSLEQRLNQVGGNFEKAIEKAANTLGTTIKDIEDRLLARIGSGGGSTGSTEGAEAPKENTSATKENTKEKQKETKTVQDSLYNLLKWQTILSFTSGVLSKFGDDAGKVGDALSGFGTALLSANEGANAIKGILKFKEGDTVKGLFSGGVESAKKAAAGAEGGKFAQAKAGAGAFLTGGGGKALAGAALTGGVYALAAYEGLKGLDSVIQILARTSEKSKNAINVLSQAQEKYSVSLDATGKKIQEQVSERFNVSGAGLSGFANQIGLTGLFRGETTKNILKTAGITNLDNQTNAALAGDIASFIIPTVQANAKEGTPFYKLQKQVEQEVVDAIKKIQEESRDTIIKETKFNTSGYKPGTKVEVRGQVNQEKFEKKLLEFRDQQSKKADDATYKLKIQQEILTANATALRKNLDITQELAKAYASIPSSLENSLSLLRESAFTSESEKDSLSFKIKILEEERRLRADINDIALSTAKEEIFKKISDGKALTPQVKGTIETGFAAINQAVTLEEKKAKIKELTLQLTGQEKDINDGLKQIIEEKLSLLDTEIQKAQTLSDIRKQQIAQENFNNSIIKQQNFYFQAQKDVFSGYLALKEQALQKEKERLGYVRQIQDAEKELSRIGKDTPRNRFQQTLEDINIEKNRKIQDAQIAARESFLANQRNVVQKLAEKPETQDLAEKALGAKSRQELINIGKDAFKLEENSFEQSVVSSAKEFYDIIIKTAVDYVAKSQPAGTSSPISSAANAAERAAQSGVMPQTLKAQKELIPKVTQEIQDLEGKLANLKLDPSDPEAQKELEQRIQKLQEFNDKLKEQVELTEKSKKKFNELSQKYPGFVEGKFGITAEPDTGKRVEEAQVTAKTRTAQAGYAELQRTDFRQGMRDSLKSIDTDLEQFGNTLGKQIPLDFRNGLVDAMKALSDPNATTSLKERLLGVASAFLNKINESLMTNFANKITGTIFGNGQGNSGIIGSAFGMSTGGQITKGSGYKDDVPAMLMKGEYVIKKSAVSKYGKSFLDKLNQGKMQGYANGGMVGFEEANLLDMTRNPNKYVPYGQARSGNLSFDENGRVVGISNYTGSQENKQDALSRAQADFYATRSQSGVGGFFTPGTYGQGAIMGQRNLLAFATQGLTGTQNDVIRGSGNAASIDIAGGSANLSLFALRNQENLRNVQYSEAQKKALDLYFGGVSAEKDKLQKEEEVRKQIEEFKARAKKEKDAMIKGFLVQIGTSLAMAGISAAGKSFMSGWNSTSQSLGADASFMDKLKGGFTGGTMGGETRGGLFNMFSSSGYKDFSVIGASQAGVKGDGLALWDSQSKKYVAMDSDVFKSNYGVANNLGRLSYDALGSPIVGGKSFQSGFNLSKLNPMNLFKSFGSSIGSAVSRRNTLNTNELGFGSTSLNSNQASYYEDAEVTINGRTFTAPVNVIDGEASYMDPKSRNWIKLKQNYSLRLAAGGYVAGNGMGDNVPAMLNGGEFVISKQAAQNIGYNNLQKMNSSAGGGTSDEFASRIEAKLEELVEKVAGVGTINISVESGKNGGTQEEEQSNSQDSKNRDMARKIKEVVLNVLREEKRIGGMLR